MQKPIDLPIHRFSDMALLLAGLALSAAPHAARLSWWVSGAAMLFFSWRLFIAWRHRALPPRWLLLVLTVAGMVGVYLTFRTIFGRDAGVTLLVLLLSLKLMEMRAPRDVFVVVFLSYFLALTNFFYSQTIPTATLMLATVLLVTASLSGASAPSRPMAANLRTAGSLLLQASPVMLLLFFLFPRVQGPLWGVPQDAYSGVTGLSDSMSPGSLSRLSTSDAIAFRVKFQGEAPPRGTMYWRGPVFWDFDGRTWRPGGGRLRPSLRFEAFGKPVDYEVTLEPHNFFWLFGLDLPASSPPNARFTSDYQMLSIQAVRTRIRYDLRSYTEYRTSDGNGEEEIASATRLPGNLNPRARGLGREWRRALGSDEAILRQAIEYIRSGGFEYTLQPPLLQQNTVDEFLFDTKKGFCEHFSGAFTFLMRAAGVPARVVTGYQGGDLNPVDDYHIVRQSDAHAWSEVYLQGRGWVRVDPTAAVVPSRIESGLASSVPQNTVPLIMREELAWLRGMRYNWDALANKWNQWVLGYNPDRQRDMLSKLGVSQPNWQNLAQLMFWSVAIVLGLMAAWLLWKFRNHDPVQAAWLSFCEKLARKGMARRPDEGPLDFAARIAPALPDKASAAHEIANLYAALRYGRTPSPDGVAQLRRAVGAFKI